PREPEALGRAGLRFAAVLRQVLRPEDEVAFRPRSRAVGGGAVTCVHRQRAVDAARFIRLSIQEPHSASGPAYRRRTRLAHDRARPHGGHLRRNTWFLVLPPHPAVRGCQLRTAQTTTDEY